jgi:RNA polymerase sigma factor (sigma-70 family)
MQRRPSSELVTVLRQAAGGSPWATNAVCSQVLIALYRVVRSKCLIHRVPIGEAADIAHDAITRAIKWMKAHPEREVNDAWVRQIAENLVRDYWRRNRRMRSLEEAGVDPPAAASVEDSQPEFDWQSIERLPEIDRQVLRLIVSDRATYRQAATRLGLTLDALYKRYQRAVARLRQASCPAFSKSPAPAAIPLGQSLTKKSEGRVRQKKKRLF